MRTLAILGMLTVVFLVAQGVTAQAGWGCLAKSGDKLEFRTWSVADQTGARNAVLGTCRKEKHPGCHIVACKEHVETQAQAFAVWPGGAPVRCYHCKTPSH